MELVKVAHKFMAISSFDERFIPKEAGFRWDPDLKKWWTDDKQKAMKLADYVNDPRLKVELKGVEESHQQALDASRAIDADIEIPAPEGLEYMAFQKGGIAFASQRESTLIGDDMGLGKTIQAIGLINLTPEIERVLVICPASLRRNWQVEMEKWLVRPLSVGISTSTVPYPDTQCVIINYDIVQKFKDELRASPWDLLIADEAHLLKNPKTLRTQWILGHSEWNAKDRTRKVLIEPLPAKRKLFLTGTPIVNRPIELFPLLQSMDPGRWKSKSAYSKRFCAGHHNGYGWEESGASNLEELQEILRTTVLLRRLKKDVLKDLPAKRRQVIEIPANGHAGLIEREKEALSAQESRLATLKVQAELAKASEDPQDYKEAVDRLREASRVSFEELGNLQIESARAKVPYVIDHVNEANEAGNKVVVFAHHHEIVDALLEGFGEKAVELTGRTKMQDRQGIVDRFQTHPDIMVFVGSIGAAGVGLTLTTSSHVVFAELSWVPGEMSQCEDRTHRIGQVNAVLVQHLVLEESIDARMAKTVVAKQNVIDKALDEEIELKRTPVLPTGESATSSTSRSQVAQLAERLTATQIQAIHEGLQELAIMCDGARLLDGAGFSKVDAAIGHSLASCLSLTPKQAALGQRIVRKYHRQLPTGLLIRAGLQKEE
jgi:SNF2 family DNA or RNA helicase